MSFGVSAPLYGFRSSGLTWLPFQVDPEPGILISDFVNRSEGDSLQVYLMATLAAKGILLLAVWWLHFICPGWS